MQNSSSKLPLTFRTFDWVFSRRNAGRALVTLAVSATLVALFYAEENWRGKRAWKAYEQKLVASGVELSWRKYAPPLVPAEQNFAMTPFLAPLFDFNPKPRPPGQSPWRDTNGHSRAINFGAELLVAHNHLRRPPMQHEGRMTDLEGSLRLLRKETAARSFSTRAETASEVLAAVEGYRPVLEELRLASRRPYSRFNLDYEADDPISVLLPHLIVLARVSLVLQLRASAQLALGHADAAFDDAGLMLFLADSLRGEPTVVSFLSRIFILRNTQQILWEGLAERRWSDAHLRNFQDRLQKITFLKDLELGLRAERDALGNGAFELVRKHPQVLKAVLEPTNYTGQIVLLRAAPSGWLYQEQIEYNRLFEEKVLRGFEVGAGQIRPRVIDDNNRRLEIALKGSWSALLRHRALSQVLLPGIPRIFSNAAAGQNSVNLAAVGCALERYRLANGKLPETLPDGMPRDVCSGQPLKYRPLEHGRFLLYSVGWNEHDDEGKASADLTQDDWVWPGYTAK